MNVSRSRRSGSTFYRYKTLHPTLSIYEPAYSYRALPTPHPPQPQHIHRSLSTLHALCMPCRVQVEVDVLKEELEEEKFLSSTGQLSQSVLEAAPEVAELPMREQQLQGQLQGTPVGMRPAVQHMTSTQQHNQPVQAGVEELRALVEQLVLQQRQPSARSRASHRSPSCDAPEAGIITTAPGCSLGRSKQSERAVQPTHW